MPKRVLPLCIAVLLILSLSSCYTVSLQSNAAAPVDLTSLNIVDDYRIVGHFEETARVSFSIGGLVKLQDVDIDSIVEKNLRKYNGDAVINVKLKTELGVTDQLISCGLGFAGGLLASSTVDTSTYEGTALSVSRGATIGSLLTFLYSTRTVTISGDVIRIK